MPVIEKKQRNAIIIIVEKNIGEQPGDYLKKLRESKKLSLRDVSTSVGMSDAAICRAENGEISTVSPILLKKLAVIYEADLVDLLVRFGYLTGEDALSHCVTFKNVERLTPAERKHIQDEIDFLISERQGMGDAT